jgi:outer membrane protein TolC
MRTGSLFVAWAAASMAVAAHAAADAQPPAPLAGPAPGPQPPAEDDRLARAVAAEPGGLTPALVAARAARLSPSVRRRRAELDAAAARVDQARLAYFPTVSLAASYTRVSPANNVVILARCPDDARLYCSLTPDEYEEAGRPPTAGFPPQLVPQFENRYGIVASLVVPVSDYPLRIWRGAAAAGHLERARELDLVLEQRLAAVNAKLDLYGWVAARAQVASATLEIEEAILQAEEAEALARAGLASRADVLALEARRAEAERLAAEATAAHAFAEARLRAALGAAAEERLGIGFSVLSARRTPPERPTDELRAQARARRPELRALDETVRALEQERATAVARYAPRLDAFANAQLQNPNPRQLPMRAEWTGSWDLGAQLSWTLNDTLRAPADVAEAAARVRAATEQRAELERAIDVEIAQVRADAERAAASIAASEKGVAAARAALAARRELFRAGESSGVEIATALTELGRARLAWIRAHVDALAARARLDYAMGRDP